MKNIESHTEEIDSTKTLLFILLSLLITIMVASMLIIPDIQQLKVAKIHSTRSLKMLQRTRDYYDQLAAKHAQLKQEHRAIIESLAQHGSLENVGSFGEKNLGIFQVKGEQSSIVEEDFLRREYNVTTTINAPTALYEFIDSLNRYESLAEITFPIIIEAREDYSLNVDMQLNVYELKAK